MQPGHDFSGEYVFSTGGPVDRDRLRGSIHDAAEARDDVTYVEPKRVVLSEEFGPVGGQGTIDRHWLDEDPDDTRERAYESLACYAESPLGDGPETRYEFFIPGDEPLVSGVAYSCAEPDLPGVEEIMGAALAELGVEGQHREAGGSLLDY